MEIMKLLQTNITIYVGLILLFFVFSSNSQDPQSLCRSSKGTKSCGECIQQHPDCAWCIDPLFPANFRCDVKSELQKSCQPTYIYQPKSELRKPQDRQIGTKKEDRTTIIQLQPQQVQIKMKPGETLDFPVMYYHNDPERRDVYMMNSETLSQGLTISYGVTCKGQELKGHRCQGIDFQEKVKFHVKITLNECKTSGDAVVSIGVGGVRDVVAVYITPLCGCECEKVQRQEQRSAHCSGYGTLVCGSCICDSGRGGGKCDCDLKGTGATTAQALENRCRAKPNEPACSGRGKCTCGKCQCTQEMVSGRYCECDDLSCPLSNGILCSGKGKCSCGTCNCEQGWTGEACDCSADTSKCMDSDSNLCSKHGNCECGRCNCDSRYSGKLCDRHEVRDTKPGSGKPSSGHTPEPEENSSETTAEPEVTTASAAELRFNFILSLFSILLIRSL